MFINVTPCFAGCTAERFFRIDRAQESLHYLIDITHDQLFVLDDPQGPLSTEEDATVVLKSKEPPEELEAQDMTARSVILLNSSLVSVPVPISTATPGK